MKKIRESTRKKIIIYYAVAIVFPSIILGILAYRGVKNDQALVEREQRRAFQESGQKINDTVNAYLKLIENNFIKVMDSTGVPDEIMFYDTALASSVTEFPVIEGVFYLSENNEVSVLNNNFLYLPDNFKGLRPRMISEQFENILNRGWDLEFRQKEYSKAIKHYKNALPVVRSVQGQGEIYNSIARIQKKIGKPEEAFKTYDTLLISYTDVYIQGNIPLGMVALLESGLLYLEIHDTVNCLETINSLLIQFKDSRWSINYPLYFNILSKIKDVINLLENDGGSAVALIQKSKSLLKSVSVLERRTAYLLAVTDAAGLIQSAQTSNADNLNKRYLFDSEGNSYFVFLSSLQTHGQWGLIYKQDYLLQDILTAYIKEIAGKSVFHWEIVNNYDDVLLGSENIITDANPVKIPFSSSLPKWTLVIYPESGGVFLSFIKTRDGIFFYIFLLIVIILACGLFFTLFTVNNELRLMRMKSNFITTVSHEFRSPLTLIRQMAEMLDSGRVANQERQQKYYSAMVQESERLSHLIDNILDFSKMEAGQKKLSFEKGNLAELVEEMAISYQHNMMDKGFRINYILPEPIADCVFDKEAIKQVVQNLIDNSCKYSGNSKIIDVEVTQADSGVAISVKDYGIGINKDEQDKIFSRFYRAGDELTQKVKGSGIGLTIVKQLVEAHKGMVKLKSEPGKGSVFKIVLPLNKTLNK